jgi:hypothetical protein
MVFAAQHAPAVGINLHAGHGASDNHSWDACVNHLATSQVLIDNHSDYARSNHLAASYGQRDAQIHVACGNTFDNQTKGQQ